MLLALLTDFGTEDVYVGVMKAVAHGLAPGVPLVDLTHAVSPQALDEGAFLLAQALPYLPEPCVVCAVVDPGVGTARRALVVRVGGRTFVAPDNGLLEPVLAAAEAAGQAVLAHAVTSPEVTLPGPSATFHGRDVFVPAAAHLAAGCALATVGPAVPPAELVRLAPGPARVVHVDRFGNLVTNVVAADHGPGARLRVGADGPAPPRVLTYGEAEEGALVCLVGSSGHLEVSVVGGSAHASLGAGRGALVQVVEGTGAGPEG